MVQISAYADDVDMSRNAKVLNEALQELDNTAQEIGLLRSQEKHKNVSVNKKTHKSV
jgi:GTP cyclohydrolase FolE2